MAVTLGGINVNFGANLGPLQSGINSAQGLIGGFGVAAAAAMVGFGVASVDAAGKFQDSLTSLVTGAGEAQSNLKLVSDGILNLSTATGTSTKQLTDGMYMIESAGYHGADGLNVLKAAAEGAKVGNADLGVVADATTTIMTDFGLKSNQAGVAVNTLTATVASGKTTMQALSASLSSILPTASAARVGLNDTMAAMATMTGEGVPAANAATFLRQMLVALENPGTQAASTLKSVGLSSAQVAAEMRVSLPDTLQMITDALAKKFPVGSQAYIKALADISGGSKQMQAMLDLTGTHLQTFKGNVDNISSSVKKGGDSINGWAAVQGNFNQQMAQLGAAVNVVEIKLGTLLLPVLTSVAKFITPLVIAFADWIGKIGSAQKATDGLSGILGKISPFLQDVGKSFSSLSPVVKQISNIVGSELSKNFQFLQNTGGQLSRWFQSDLLPAIKSAMPGFQSLASTIITVVVPAVLKIWAAGQDLTRTIISAFIPVFEHVVPPIIKFAGVISNVLAVAIKFIAPYVVQAAQAISQFAGDIATRIAPIITQWFDNIATGVKTFGAIWNAFWPYIAPILKGIWDEIVGVVKIAWALVSGIIKIGLDLLSGNWKQAWTDFKDMLGGIWDGIKTVIKGGLNIVIGLINDFTRGLNGIHISIPGVIDWHPSIPQIPQFASGVQNFSGGLAIVGERGPELVNLPGGSSVYPSGTGPGASQGNGDQHIYIMFDGNEMAHYIGKKQQRLIHLHTGIK